MGMLDAAVVFVFLAYVVVAGLRDRRLASGDLEQYFLAGRTLNGWQAGISMAATQFAADTPLLVTGLVAAGGIFALWRLWIYALAFLLLAFVLAACWRRAGVLTDAEFAELRYSGRGAALLRMFKAIYFGTVFNCVVLAIVLLAATRIAEAFLFWDQWLPAPVFEVARWFSAPIAASLTATPAGDPVHEVRAASNLISLTLIAAITLVYSTLGGLRSVVRTDLVQFAIMMIGSCVYAWLVVDRAGGLEGLHQGLVSAFSGPAPPSGMTLSELLAFMPSQAHDVTSALLAVIALQWLIQLNSDGTGYLAQRTMACRDDREARRAAIVFTFAQVLVRSLFWLPVALGLLVLFPAATVTGASYTAARETTYVLGIAQLFPPGLLGLMLTAMLAALASTLDTHLNWGASYWANDIYARFYCRWRASVPNPRAQVRVARAANVLLLGIAFVVMGQLGSIRGAWEASLLLGAGVGVVLVLRWLWWRLTALGELAAIAGSACLVPTTLAMVDDANAPLRLLLVALGSTASAVAVSLWIMPARPEMLKDFYLRVKPPGAWGAVAMLTGEETGAPMRRLARGLAAALLCALTVFGLLIGIGTWLVQATPPAWLPHRGAWIALNLIVALGVSPLWLRAAGNFAPQRST